MRDEQGAISLKLHAVKGDRGFGDGYSREASKPWVIDVKGKQGGNIRDKLVAEGLSQPRPGSKTGSSAGEKNRVRAQ